MAAPEKDNVEKAINSLGPLAKAVNKTAGGLWSIFVRRYIAIGAGELMAAAAVVGVSLWLFPHKSLWLLVPFAIAIGLTYDAIVNLINPHYPAMDKVIEKVSGATKPAPVEIVSSQRYY